MSDDTLPFLYYYMETEKDHYVIYRPNGEEVFRVFKQNGQAFAGELLDNLNTPDYEPVE